MSDETPLPLPELARSLRMLGTPGDAATEAAHAAVFGPLLAARTRAAAGGASAALAALRGEAIAARIAALTHTAAEAGGSDAPRRRARAARAGELLEPLRAELVVLDGVALKVPTGARAPSTPEWEAWVAQLRRVFSAADVAYGALAELLAADPAGAPPRRRWLGRGGGGGGR